MAFKIIVCAKQVPDTNVIKINPKTGTLINRYTYSSSITTMRTLLKKL